MVFGGLGLCIGIAAALTAVFPRTALWMSPLVCDSPYQLTYRTSHYSYRPGQSGVTVSFRCVSGTNWYGVSEILVMGLQFLVAAALVGCAAVLFRMFRRR